MNLPYAIHDFPIRKWPITIQMYAHDGELVWEHTADPPMPGVRKAIKIPASEKPITRVRAIFGDGEVSEYVDPTASGRLP